MQIDEIDVGDKVYLVEGGAASLGIKEEYQFCVFEVRGVSHTGTVMLESVEPKASISVNQSYLKYIKPTSIERKTSEFKTKYLAWVKEAEVRLKALRDQVSKIHEVLTGIYGENYEFVDANIERADQQSSINIKFPEITVTNGHIKRTIKDLWVRLNFVTVRSGKQLRLRFAGMSGTRSAMSVNEFQSSYMFSHLRTSNNMISWHGFCLGHTDFAMNVAQLQDTFDIDKFELFLHQLNSYLQWESLDGGPYVRLDSIQQRNAPAQATTEDINKAYAALMNSDINIPCGYNIGNSEYYVDKTEQFEIDLGTCTDNKASKVNGHYYGTVQNNDVGIKRLMDQHRDMFRGTVLMFKGQAIKPTLYAELDVQKEGVILANPNVTTGVINKLNIDINEFILRNAEQIKERLGAPEKELQTA